jgi:hypothetical protein
MCWRTILKYEDDYMVRRSVWVEAEKEGSGIGRDKTHDVSTQKQLEEALSRPLTANDYMFIIANWRGNDVRNHLGNVEFKRMMDLFKNKEYQIDTREGRYSSEYHWRVNRKSFNEKYGELYD